MSPRFLPPARTRRRALALLCAGIALALCAPAPASDAAGFALPPYRGKVVLLDFWASWCAPCKESFPWMQRLQERYADKGLVVVAVNVDHDRQLAEKFLRAQRPSFAIVFDPEGRIAEQYQVSSMPSSFYIDRQGQVRHAHQGFRNGERDAAEREIVALLDAQ